MADPAGAGAEQVRAIVDDIETRITALLRDFFD